MSDAERSEECYLPEPETPVNRILTSFEALEFSLDVKSAFWWNFIIGEAIFM